MQTFLPYPDFRLSAIALDNRRLGKQRVEGWQILEVLRSKREKPYNSTGWMHHPAVLMWEGYEHSLATYTLAVIGEWQRRAFNDSMLARVSDRLQELHGGFTKANPPWLGDQRLHSSHRAALLFKDPEFYGKNSWNESPGINYWWPTKEKSNGA